MPRAKNLKRQSRGALVSNGNQNTEELPEGSGPGSINTVYDSSDLASPLSNTPDSMQLQEPDPKSRKSSSPMLETADHPGLLRDEIIGTALTHSREKRKFHMSDCFDAKDRLYKRLEHLNEDISQARKERKVDAKRRPALASNAIVEDTRSKQSEATLRLPELERSINVVQKPLVRTLDGNEEHTQKMPRQKKRKQLADDSTTSYRFDQPEGMDNERESGSHTGGMYLPSTIQEKGSLSTALKLGGSKDKISTTPSSGIQSFITEGFRSKRILGNRSEKVKPEPFVCRLPARGTSKTGRRQPQLQLQPSTHTQAPIQTSTEEPKVRFALDVGSQRSSEQADENSAQQMALVPTILTADPTTLTTAPQQGCYAAAQSIRATLQKHSLTAHSSPMSLEDILCNGETCSKSWFSDTYLSKHLGISLRNAQESRRKYGFWLCPECNFKKGILRPRGPDNFASTHALPRNGLRLLEPEDVSHSLNELRALTSLYVRLATKNPSIQGSRKQLLLEIPCIREEVSGGQNSLLVSVLRRVLKVDAGVLVKDFIFDLQIQDLGYSVWMGIVIASLFHEFVFDSASPFDDPTFWREGLIHSFDEDVVDMWIQDSRIRATRGETGSYQMRRKAQQHGHVMLLNAAMMPLVGRIGEGLKDIHERIAELACDMNAKKFAYKGDFAPLMPEMDDQFDSRVHDSDDPMDEDKDLSNRQIMFSTRVGVSVKVVGQPLRILAKAKVRLW